jgi:hypothetical protein
MEGGIDSRFSQAVKTSILEIEVCGRVLKPMCLRHRLILQEIESPLVMQEKVVSPHDLIIAARILHTYDLKEMLSINATKAETDIFTRIFLDNEEYKKEMDKMSLYMNSQDNMPIIWDRKKQTASRGVPVVLACVANLTKNGIGYEKAWTMPESEAMWMYLANVIADGGDINILTQDDIDSMKKLEAMEEEIKAAKEKRKSR